MKKLFLVFGICVLSGSGGAWAAGPASPCRAESARIGDPAFSVEMERYEPRGVHRGTVFVVPPIFGINAVDRHYAKALCQAGFQSGILVSWTGDDEGAIDLGLHQRLYERAQRAIGLAISQVPATEEIGLLGNSQGGIFTAVATALQPRVRSAFVVVAGENLAHVIARSRLKVIADLKERRSAAYGYRDEGEYERALRPEISLDPALAGDGFHGKRLGMVIGLRDETVPTQDQWELQARWKPTYLRTVRAGHRTTVLWTALFHTGEVVRFFEGGN